MKKSFALLTSVFFIGNLYLKELPIIEYKSINHPIIDNDGMVVSQRIIASEVGAEILRQGGNAVDSAVATGLALAVVLPRAGNIGGGGFMVIHLKDDNKTLTIDYREKAPAAAHRDLFLDENGDYDRSKAQFSLLSAGVPGSVAGFYYALTNYGTMSWQDVLKPSIKLAEEGFVIPHDLANTLASKRYRERLSSDPAASKVFYKADGSLYQAGEILIQNDLASTLKKISKFGPDAFYRGDIAKLIAREMQLNGGLITLEDLDNYNIVEREPLVGSYKGFKIVSMPPSSSGGTHLIQMLNQHLQVLGHPHIIQ